MPTVNTAPPKKLPKSNPPGINGSDVGLGEGENVVVEFVTGSVNSVTGIVVVDEVIFSVEFVTGPEIADPIVANNDNLIFS